MARIILILLLFQWCALAIAEPTAKPTGFTNNDCTALYAEFTEQRLEGPRVVVHAEKSGLRNWEEMKTLVTLQYNVENLFNYQGKWGYAKDGKWTMLSPPKEKPKARWMKLKENILRTNPDIMAWQEVENLQAAQEFVDTMLEGKYKVVLIEGNDSRGIDVAFLIKKDLPFDIVARSNRDVTENGKKLFSRDLLIAELWRSGSNQSDDVPILKYMVTHNKSQRDSPGDPRSVKLRTAQIAKQAEIAKKESITHPGTPTFLLGDLNADVRSAPEFQPLWASGFKDSFDLANDSVPKSERVTQSYFPQGGAPVYNQLDGILASPSTQQYNIIQKMEIVPDLDETGKPMALPKSFAEREKQASDHRGVKMILDFEALKGHWVNKFK